MQFLKEYRFGKLKEIRCFNYPIVQINHKISKEKEEKIISVFPKSFEKKVLDKIIKTISKKHDLVWIIRTAGLGEAYLLNFMMEELNNKYNAKNPCIVSINGYYRELFSMYSNIPFYKLDISREENHIAFLNRCYKYKGRIFRVHHCTHYESMNLFNNKFSKGLGKPYPVEIMNMAGAEKYTYVKPNYNHKLITEVNSITGDLDINNFIYIIPEANSVYPLSDNFWNNICQNLRKKGYDIFINTKNGVSNFGRTAKLNIAQASYLASLSKGIVAVRCGFLEIVSAHNIPQYVVYTPHRVNPVSASGMLKSSSLKHYPFVNIDNLLEFNIDEMDEDEILKQITKGF